MALPTNDSSGQGAAMALIAHASSQENYAAAAYLGDPTPCDTNPTNGVPEFCPSTWQSTTQFVADINQPPPTVDPFTNYAYFTGPCPGWPVDPVSGNGVGVVLPFQWGT